MAALVASEAGAAPGLPLPDVIELGPEQLRAELLSIRELLAL
jgi:hypothetical protein